MEQSIHYCEAVKNMPWESPHKAYHDTEYGFPLHSDDELFGRLILEINQAGLSWTTILNKKDNFRRAYSNFNIDSVARYGDSDRKRLLSDPGIVRNRLKVDAALHNAGVIREIQREFGSFKAWLDIQGNLDKPGWIGLFRKYFRFTGGEITGEFLMSMGYLKGAHTPDCPIYQEVLKENPHWSNF